MASIFSCSMTSGMMRVTGQFLALFHGRSPWMVAIIIWGVVHGQQGFCVDFQQARRSHDEPDLALRLAPWMFLPAAALYSSAALGPRGDAGFFSQT